MISIKVMPLFDLQIDFFVAFSFIALITCVLIFYVISLCCQFILLGHICHLKHRHHYSKSDTANNNAHNHNENGIHQTGKAVDLILDLKFEGIGNLHEHIFQLACFFPNIDHVNDYGRELS